MTDLEITKLCAEAMGIEIMGNLNGAVGIRLFNGQDYDPLHDDAQAMALVKKFGVKLERVWRVKTDTREGVADFWLRGDVIHLNRAICECVAKMQLAKGKA